MFKLQNPRHETFALAIAQGATPEAAYHRAGFSDNNRKARSLQLAQEPEIAERITYLKYSLPRIDNLRDRFAPSVLLMPETASQMKAWLWQVANGTREILPIQLRAATLLCRLNGWHLPSRKADPASPAATPDSLIPASNSNSAPDSNSSPAPAYSPSPNESHLLATFNKHTITHDTAIRPVPETDSQTFYSSMADVALLDAMDCQNSFIHQFKAGDRNKSPASTTATATISSSPSAAPTQNPSSSEPSPPPAQAPTHQQTASLSAPPRGPLLPVIEKSPHPQPVPISQVPAPSPFAFPKKSPSHLPHTQPIIPTQSPNGDKKQIPQTPLPSKPAALRRHQPALAKCG